MPHTISSLDPTHADRPTLSTDWAEDMDTRSAASSAIDRVRTYVRSNPKKSLFTVAALGLVVAGLVAKRRMS